ncbi:DUF4168 domain-containing protein [Haloflavibacter putidus]|uniref:DUF4168 domain-containing protein n=1 Tax=Haloflavibacter putidus TaxID=2576776 RepID=A0A507ZR10_9FLAO|nr:DUF4168 domain-containing protein [Haloflavibacter putidus]TQD40030.1 DUF4168 domain-containing protein [Haloflavibacter putidus]
MFKSIKLKGLFFFVAILSSVAYTNAQENKISDAELNKWANAYQKVQMQNQEAQQQMMTMIQDEGMELQRFNEIQQASMNPNQKGNATEAEIKKHKSISDKIEKMRPELERKATEAIESTGMSIERYQEIAAVIQQDQSLQQRLQKIMMQQQG